MKKHKSVVAILLAVMMIFTMMPMMAFADAESDAAHKVKWAKDYSSVSIDGTSYNTVREFTSAGTVKATADLSDYTGIYEPDPAYYYDLGSAKFAAGNKALTANYAAFSNWQMADGILFSAPDYVTAASKTVTAPAVALSTLNVGKWHGEFVTTKDGEAYTVEDKGTEDQTFDVAIKVTFPDSSKTDNMVIGSIAPKTVTIKGAAEGTVNAEFWMDEVSATVSGSNKPFTYYDGAEHTVVTKPVKGFTEPEWSVYDAATGNWNAVSAVTLKDVSTVEAKATFYKTSDTKKENAFDANFTAEIKPLKDGVRFAFDRDPAKTKYNEAVFEVTKGTSYNPVDFIVAYPRVATSEKQAAAVAANKDELMAYFNDYAKFTTTTKKADPDVDYVSFALNKELKAADLAALDKKYATLIKNFGIAANGGVIGTGSTTVYNAPASADFEVEFTSAPEKKVIHVKKAKKTKKAYTLKVKAEASNGAAVTYKLINANSKIKINKTTGKITIKKGLKKGTYNIKVKAYVPEMNEYGYAQETQAIKIVVKK